MRVHAGDTVAGASQFQTLYERHQPDVLAYFLRRLNPDDAVEATADVFVTAWARIDDVPPSAEARLWLFGVARNVLRNRRRTNRRMRRLVAKIAGTRAQEPAPLPETVVVRRDEDREILAALDRLETGDREVIALRLWEELGFGEIGDVLGCSRHAAEQRYAKALKRLRSACRRTGHVRVTGAETVTQRMEQSGEE